MAKTRANRTKDKRIPLKTHLVLLPHSSTHGADAGGVYELPGLMLLLGYGYIIDAGEC